MSSPDDVIDLMLLYATGTADEAERAEAERLLASGDPAAAAAMAEAEQLAAALAGTSGRVEATDADWEALQSQLVPSPADAGESESGANEWDHLILPEPKPISSSSPMWSQSLRGSPLLAAAVAVLVTLLAAYALVRPKLEALATAESEVEHKIELLERSVAARVAAESGQEQAVRDLTAVRARLADAERESNAAAEREAELQTELAVVRRRAENLTREYAAAQQQVEEAQRRVAEAEALAASTERRAGGAEEALRLALDPNSSLAALAAQPDQQPTATGDAVLNRDQNALRLAVAGLTPPAPDRTYQAWALPAEGNPISLGIFEVGTDGTGTLAADLPPLPGELNAVAISLAPAGGDEGLPTGPIVLVGALR